MAFRRNWLIALALTPVTFVVAFMTGNTFPFVTETLGLRCSGEGDFYRCPANEYYLGGIAYSAALVTISVAVLSMLVVVAITPPNERRLLAYDLLRLTLVVAALQVAAGAAVAVSIGGHFLLAGLLHLLATVVLFVSVSRSSRALAIVACIPGIASAVSPLISPVFGAVQATTGTCFLILLLALVAPWGAQSRGLLRRDDLIA